MIATENQCEYVIVVRGAMRVVVPAAGDQCCCSQPYCLCPCLALPLTAAEEMGLSPGQTTSWLLATYGLMGAMALGLAIAYRQPLMFTGNIFSLIFIVSLGGQFGYAEIVGAFIVTGVVVLVLGLPGLTTRPAKWLPTPIVFGLLAGAVMPFVSRVFTLLVKRHCYLAEHYWLIS